MHSPAIEPHGSDTLWTGAGLGAELGQTYGAQMHTQLPRGEETFVRGRLK